MNVAITGARGYLGSVIGDAFAAGGHRVVPLLRDKASSAGARHYDLREPVEPATLDEIQVLVHCAFDMSLRTRGDIWAVNVDGTARLLAVAAKVGVRRAIVVSSIAAFAGTNQVYGQAKLAIEAIAGRYGAVVVRPGLVFGPHAGGMVGSLRRTLALPIVPLMAGRSHQYLIHEADLADAVVRIAGLAEPPRRPLVIAGPEPVSMADVVRTIGHAAGRTPRLVPVPWRAAHLGLLITERVGLRLPFRADSLWGLAHPPPPPPSADLRLLDIQPRRFTLDNLTVDPPAAEALAA